MRKKNYALRYQANQPAERIFVDSIISPETALSRCETLSVLVWNIFKQQKSGWLDVLKRYATECQFVLLQEAQTSADLIDFATTHFQVADQVPALRFPLPTSGVMTLASVPPLYCHPLRVREPLLRLLKSALVTVYPLAGECSLMVVNVHAVNFCLGTHVYSKQLNPIGSLLEAHHGPIIMAGDFNAWSRQRIVALHHFAKCMGLQEVNFESDSRKRAFGHPLDFIFYRDLDLKSASILHTRASDHNPLFAEFTVHCQH